TGTPTVSFTCNDSLAGVASCTPPVLVGEGANQTISGAAMDKAGNSASTSIMHVNVDVTAPTVNLINPSNSGSYVLNQSAIANYGCADAGSSGLIAGSAGCGGPVASGAQFDTASVGSKNFTVNAKDVAGNTYSKTSLYGVFYSTAACLGSPGHAILQPIDLTGSSVFPKKQGSTVPAKFRVCDANGVSIGTPGVVTDFKVIQIYNGTLYGVANEDPVSTTPDTMFRWTGDQWMFNISTKPLNAGSTYFYRISLNDGTSIDFDFGLR
ncbi:MAG TPA: PxKF domain-containing protein, partial [Blastocatellia bacterium]|nr:PxKF domain-containing protein [Blastocatellia bacterium]